MKHVLLTFLLTLPLAASEDVERTVAMMAKIGSAYAPSFSPDGNRIAFLTNLSGTPQAWIVASNGGWPDQITAFDDPVTAIEWAPDGAWIALQVAPGGGLNSQIYIVKPDGTGARRLTDGTKTNNWLGRWMPDSSSIAVASNRRDGGAMDTWKLGLDGSWTLLARNPGIGTISDISTDGKRFLIDRLRSRGDEDAYLLADGKEVLLTKHTPPATIVGTEFGAGEDTYIGSNIDRDLHAFGRITVRDGVAGPFEVLVARSDAELSEFLINEQGTVAALVWNVAGRSELTFYHPKTGEHRRGKDRAAR